MGQVCGSKGKIAWCLSPVLSGVATVYRVVGGGLRRAGWEVTGFVSGADKSGEMDTRFADPYCEVLVAGNSDVRQNATEFVHRIVERKIEVVFCTGQMFTIAGAPALPRQVRLITRCAVMTRRGYKLAAANLNRINAVVVETPRQYRDMVRDWKVNPKKCVIIPGGVDVQYYGPGTLRNSDGALRLLYLGRLDEDQKAVLMLPRIASQLAAAGVEFHFDIIGNGPDRDRLADAFARAYLNARVTFHGTLRGEEALPFLQRAHLFLLPTRYEGVPWALLETMACGCVPIVSRIAGTTDYIVDHGTNGLLCTVGKASEFTQAIMDLAADRKRLATFSVAAVRAVQDRFTLERVVRDHDELLQALLVQEPLAYTPIPVTAIRSPNLADPKWRRLVPQGVKNYVRTWAERFHRSV
jgi:glycosyltransferase involved in cell wall biosynthesis